MIVVRDSNDDVSRDLWAGNPVMGYELQVAGMGTTVVVILIIGT